MNMYDQILGTYAPGGGFGAGMLSDIERQKQRDIQSATQSLVGSGLYGTTRTAGLGTQWEREVGSQARLNLGDQLAQRYTGALGQKAEAIERREDVAPSAELMAGLVTGAESGTGGDGGTSGSGGTGGTSGTGGTGTAGGTVDVSDYWETGQFSSDTAVRAFSRADSEQQEQFLRHGVRTVNGLGQKISGAQKRLDTLQQKMEAESDARKKEKLQKQVTKQEQRVNKLSQQRDTAQGTY